MPNPSQPRDRFDSLPDDTGRVGAHRAENPHMSGWLVFTWAAVATVVLVGAGIFGTLVASGKISLGPSPSPTLVAAPEATPVLDPSYSVLVLNATGQAGLAASVREQVVAAGWTADNVQAGDAGTKGFEKTTVYYALPADEGAAHGLAQAIGGAQVAQSDAYQPANDPEAKQLAIVIGMDRASGGSKASPSK
jgi:hypothetical protein